MRFLLIVLLCLTSGFVSAQDPFPINKLKPAYLVLESKKSGSAFRSYDLFSAQKKQQRNTKSLEDPSELLKIDKSVLGQLFKDRPNQLALDLPSHKKESLELELVQVDNITDDFKVVTSSGQEFDGTNFGKAIFYRGIVKEDKQSIATIAIIDNEVVGMISTPDLGNLSLERDLEQDEHYHLFSERNGTRLKEFYCDVVDEAEGYSVAELSPVTTANVGEKCTKIYFEVDYDIYKDKGSVEGVANYVRAVFHEVATLYANEQVKIEISEIFIWDQPSPYNGRSSLEMLNKFQTERTTFNGDLAQLLSYKASGGIAVVSGLCHPVTAAKMSFASIEPTFNTVPSYSFTVLVVAHELGHLFGSMHTHACVWNGNNTAIDGCAGFVEGSCPNDKGIPALGGTIMSYCHLTRAGTNFSHGFGVQPGNLIRNRVNNASCLAVCGTEEEEEEEEEKEDPVACSSNQIDFTLSLDDYPMEVVWRIEDENGQEWYAGGPYVKEMANQVVTESFCLPSGKYEFIIEDYYGDGLCCGYGDGFYLIKDSSGKLITSGSQFSNKKETAFVLGAEDDPEPSNVDCITVNFSDYDINSYGGVQDRGEYELKHGGKSLKLTNSSWKSINIDYIITSETVLEFDFASTQVGDIHAIGFDNDEIPSGSRSFKIFGLQDWGILDYADYEGNSVWKKYRIPVGQYYTGTIDRLFFVSDDDFGDPRGNSYFRNIKIYDGFECETAGLEGVSLDLEGLPVGTPDQYDSNAEKMNVFPNPAKNRVLLDFFTLDKGEGQLIIYNINESPIMKKKVAIHRGRNAFEIDLPALSSGSYFAELQLNGQRLTHKIEIVN